MSGGGKRARRKRPGAAGDAHWRHRASSPCSDRGFGVDFLWDRLGTAQREADFVRDARKFRDNPDLLHLRGGASRNSGRIQRRPAAGPVAHYLAADLTPASRLEHGQQA